jgi:mRNA interferase RelE/StbE
MYSVEIARAAQRTLGTLPAEVRQRLVRAIDALASEPRGPGVESLKGRFQGLHKARVGEYRIVIEIDDARRLVAVVRVGHRSNVYK